MNELSLMPERLENYRIINHLSKSDMATKLNITPEKYSKIIHRKYDGSFTEYEHFANKLYKEPDKQYEFFTGKHIESQQPAPNCTTEMRMLTDTIKDLSHIIMHLSAKMDNLSAEMRALREVSTHQGEILEHLKIPDP